MQSRTQIALANFIGKYIARYEEEGVPLKVDCDDSWLSPCCTTTMVDGVCVWQPVRHDVSVDFSQVEKGMDMRIHQDFQDYFCTYWADHLNARASQGDLQLLMVWNEDDFIRLQENLIAHLLMKRRLGQRDTLFFAQTEDDNYILSVLNETGEVILEPVGQEPKKVIASDLATFLRGLEPVVL
ncbi:SecY-interacting protein [Alteromonas sp. a30]|uniref:SecY-interacting protein n=1 Tax=Alteromonas sp. a30 TaxID=2730917 RepID=UPI0022810A15|nr:SecY-interacting protein [Alteromonas sp. a30]MCY7294336.1 SecY-interacting protein [Alteromonas sp. a30]